jgi:uncharacterized membrane protein YkvA (DUF1232 family)
MPVDFSIRYGRKIREQMEKGKNGLRFVMREARTLTLLLRHPSAPWSAKLVAALAVGYIVSPIQLIPSFIPVIGQLDDLTVLFIARKLVRRIVPAAILAECEGQTARRPSRTVAVETCTPDYRLSEASS